MTIRHSKPNVPEGMTLAMTIGIRRCGGGWHAFIEFPDDTDDFDGPHRDSEEQATDDAAKMRDIFRKVSGKNGTVVPAYTVH